MGNPPITTVILELRLWKVCQCYKCMAKGEGHVEELWAMVGHNHAGVLGSMEAWKDVGRDGRTWVRMGRRG